MGGAGDQAAKRQKTNDPGEIDRRKTLGMLTFDTGVAGTTRLPLINVYAKKRGSKVQERLCLRFLTQGYYCGKENCKLPHITNMNTLDGPNKEKFISFVKTQAGFGWAEGKAPPGES